MSDNTLYPVPENFKRNAHIDLAKYQQMYQESIEAPEKFFAQQADEFLTWDKKWHKVVNANMHQGTAEWFAGAKINVSTNCIDRHLGQRAEQTALIWEGDDPGQDKTITYAQLSDQVNRLANVLKSRGIVKGDRVCIYMPMIPEAVYAMLACARIGAVHCVVFAGFSADAVKDRILDAECQAVITADQGLRGGKAIPLKSKLDRALESCAKVHTSIVVKRTGAFTEWVEGRDICYHQASEAASNECAPELMDAEDPLFILYTSGSTGKPKGVLHTTAGYLLQVAMTHKYVFDYQEGDVYWCTADVGWVTGHSYLVYGPLANGAISLIFEGVPTYPTASRCWDIIDKHQVNTFYTAPTAIRALMGAGDEHVLNSSRDSLKLLGTVGEPINPEAWHWYHEVIGKGKCPIVDTWWQTETGAHMLTPLPGATALKPGAACLPFFGVVPAILDGEGKEITGAGEGALVIKSSWPSQIRSVYGDFERCVQTYFSTYKGYYFTGDGARRDEDGYYWITGRVDDVLNVSGHRLGTAEIESALVRHSLVAEAAVVGCPHNIKGQGIYCYVTLMNGVEPDAELKKALVQMCVKEIGAIAKPDIIQWSPNLPKTRSGKIMRRILRKIAANEIDGLGDTSTLADASVLDDLISQRVDADLL
jgi:acetyl-CoA synthetase